jgi:hypothetical protein
MAGIRGTIPSVLGNLASLRILNLFHNQFTGTIPAEVLSLPQLVSVHIGMNRLTGDFPRFLSSNLEVFEMEGNQFNGPLPDKIAHSYPGLIALELSNNTFTGTLPEDLCRATNLDKLNLAFNSFHGVIPRCIGQLTNLEGLFLNDNSLYGTIPPTFTNKGVKLIQLFLQHNQLSGTIPASLSEIHTLQDFFVDGKDQECVITRCLSMHRTTNSRTVRYCIEGNKLTGRVPMELCGRPLNDVFFESVPDSQNRNGCESISCALNFKSKEGIYPCEQCPKSKYTPYLGWNGLCITVQERHILETLYQVTQGREWLNAERWGNPNVPHCMYEGIDCNEDGMIVNITLSRMNLQGSIPGKLGRLAHLRHLQLDGNKLTGVVPSDLRFPPLETLLVGDNQFLGPLPPLLCDKEGINGNGMNGILSCDVIACPEGTWYWNGRAGSPGRHCLPCPRQPFVGQARCFDSIALTWMERAQDYVSTHWWPTSALILVLCSLAVIALYKYTFLTMKKREEKDDQSSTRLKDDYDGVYDANGFEQDLEELTVMTYPSRPQHVNGASSEMGHLPIEESLKSESPTLTAAVSGRTTSPDDDPDTQDLWLDVPKIA